MYTFLRKFTFIAYTHLMEIMQRIFLIIFLSVFIIETQAQNRDAVFNFLNLPVSTRANALGGNNISVIENDLALVFQNPAFLGQEMDMSVNIGYMFYVADIGSGSVIFAKAAGTRSAWGIGVNYVGYGNMKETTIDNIIIGDFSAKDMCINSFFSRDLTEKLRGGVTAKFIYSSYDIYSSIGLAVDVGLSYYDKDHDLSLGFIGKNLGRQITAYNEEIQPLPWDIQLGMTKRLSHAPIRFSLTAQQLYQWKFDPVIEGQTNDDSFTSTLFKHILFGIEFIPSENFWIGLGYNPKMASDMKLEQGNKMGGFSFGAGIRVKAFDIGASVSQFHPSATSFHINVGVSLSEMKL